MEIPAVTDYLQSQYGAQVKEINGDGTFKISRQTSDGTWQESTIDARAMLLDELSQAGIKTDPSKVALTSPESPVGESSLPFMTQYNLAKAATPKDQYKYLVQELGKDNVKLNRAGQLVTKTEDGIWSEAKTNSMLASFVSSEGSALAGSIAGAKFGAGVGSAFPGLGTAIGTAVGAGLGAVIGKIATIRDAYAAGIRSDFDAADVSKELAKEFLMYTAGEGVGAAVFKAAPKALNVPKAFNSLGEQAAKAADSPAAQEFTATLLSKSSGVESPVYRFILDKETSQFYQKYADEAIDFVKVKGNLPIEQAPLMASAEEKLMAVTDFAKKKMQNDHGAVLEVLKKPLQEAFIPADELASKVSLDAIKANRGTAMGTLEGNIFRQLSKKLNINMQVGEGALSAGWKGTSATDLLDTVKWLDGELSKRYAIGMKMNPEYVGQLSQVSNQLKNIITEKLHGRIVELPGGIAPKLKSILGREGTNLDLMNTGIRGQYKADELFGHMQNIYSRRSDFLEQFGAQVDPARVGSFATKLMRPDSAALRGSLVNLLEDVGLDGQTLIRDMYGKYAAQSTAFLANPSRTSSNFLTGIADIVTGPLGSSPRMAARYAKAISNEGFSQMKQSARAVEFMSNLSPKAKQVLLDSPQLMQELQRTIMTEQGMTESIRQQLMQQGVSAVRGQ